MNQTTADIIGNYKPKMALVIFQEEVDAETRSNYYIESHVIDAQGSMLEGKPLSQNAIEGMVGVFFDENKNRSSITGFIPENILAYDFLPAGRYRLIWYRPAEQRVLHFAEKLIIPSGLAWVPPMVYVSNGDSLDVYAFNDSKRPDPETILFRAPYHNVSEKGDVCLGSAKVSKPKDQTYGSIIKYWEDMFWMSEFSHITGDDSPVKGNLNLLWKELIENPTTPFPVDQLINPEKKLKSLLR